MLNDDEEDSNGIGVVGFMSERMETEALFWRLVCGLKMPPAEIDKWSLSDMRLASAWMDMQSDYKRVWEPYYDIKKEDDTLENEQG